MNNEMFAELIKVGNAIVGAIEGLSNKIEAIDVGEPVVDNGFRMPPDPPTLGTGDLGDMNP